MLLPFPKIITRTQCYKQIGSSFNGLHPTEGERSHLTGLSGEGEGVQQLKIEIGVSTSWRLFTEQLNERLLYRLKNL